MRSDHAKLIVEAITYHNAQLDSFLALLRRRGVPSEVFNRVRLAVGYVMGRGFFEVTDLLRKAYPEVSMLGLTPDDKVGELDQHLQKIANHYLQRLDEITALIKGDSPRDEVQYYVEGLQVIAGEIRKLQQALQSEDTGTGS